MPNMSGQVSSPLLANMLGMFEEPRSENARTHVLPVPTAPGGFPCAQSPISTAALSIGEQQSLTYTESITESVTTILTDDTGKRSMLWHFDIHGRSDSELNLPLPPSPRKPPAVPLPARPDDMVQILPTWTRGQHAASQSEPLRFVHLAVCGPTATGKTSLIEALRTDVNRHASSSKPFPNKIRGWSDGKGPRLSVAVDTDAATRTSNLVTLCWFEHSDPTVAKDTAPEQQEYDCIVVLYDEHVGWSRYSSILQDAQSSDGTLPVLFWVRIVSDYEVLKELRRYEERTPTAVHQTREELRWGCLDDMREEWKRKLRKKQQDANRGWKKKGPGIHEQMFYMVNLERLQKLRREPGKDWDRRDMMDEGKLVQDLTRVKRTTTSQPGQTGRNWRNAQWWSMKWAVGRGTDGLRTGTRDREGTNETGRRRFSLRRGQ